ncbi:hemerythrin domain-containing protein [Amorphus sp. 3PC139-8]|uniref:hemerythrin domain-containing protein n=1 Tax=Amorphus sp. 3PC139-8 TaxID=2735676 RepID=UPI00345D53E8
MFRQILAELRGGGEEVADRRGAASDYVHKLARYGSFFVSQLHEHHHLEDMHYFPLLAAAEPRLEAGFTLLDGDHKSLDAHLGRFVDEANVLLQTLQTEPVDIAAGRAAAFAEGIGTFEGFLDRHLTDEEDIIVPILLEHGEGRFG